MKDMMKDNIHTNKETEEKDDFSLYTEKIVVNPFVKYKKLLAAVRFVFMAIAFGLIAAAVMAWTYPHFARNEKEEQESKKALVLDKDEYPSDAIIDETVSESGSGNQSQGQNQSQSSEETAPVLTYVELLAKIQKSLVVVTDTTKSEAESIVVPRDSEKAGGQETSKTGGEEETATVSTDDVDEPKKETVGVIIGELTGRYFVMTNNTVVSTFEKIIIQIGEDTEVSGEIISVDTRTDLALLAFSRDKLTETDLSQIAVAQLGNSYIVKQGDDLVVAGRLYGKVKTADKAYVTSTDSAIAIDSCYGIINTGVRGTEGDYCFFFDAIGQVVGVSKLTEDDGKIVANGISDYKALIEKMSVNAERIYLGIKGTNVTSSMANNYNLPYGIYITEVVIDSPAFYAGLQVGDVITAVDGAPLLAMQQLSDKLYSCHNGQQIQINIKRPGMTEYRDMTFKATLGIR